MQTIHPLEILLVVSGSLAIALLSSILTTAYHHQRNRRIYNRAWNAARKFYEQNPN